MEKIYQFNNLNENTSHDQLFDFTKPESTNKKTIPHKTLIEKLINKISPLNESISSIHLNNSISSNKNNKDKNIDFIDNKKKASQLTDTNKQRKSLNSLSKKKRKSSSMNLMDNNPLTFIESLKKIEEKKSNYGKILMKIKYCDIFLGLLSLISMIFALIDNELYSIKSLQFLNNKMEQLNIEIWTYEIILDLKNRKITKSENFLRVLNFIVSIIACLILIIKYNYQLYAYKIDKKISDYDNLFSSGLIIWLLLECIVTLIFFPPNLNIIFSGIRLNVIYAYSLNAIFLPLNSLKLYNVFRLVMIVSRYNTRVSQTICQSYKIESGLNFVIKSEINNKKIITISFFVIFLCILESAIIRDFECLSFEKNNFLEGKKGLNDLQNYMNNFWLVLITFTNVGFGDEYPRTFFGRIIIFFVSFGGLLGLGILIATLSEKLEFTQNEKKAYSRLKKIFDPENLEHKSVNIIKTILLMARNIKRRNKIIEEEKSGNLREKICLLLKIRAETKCFANELHVSRIYSMPINDLVKTLENKLYDNLLDISKDLENINSIENDFISLENNQKFIQEKLKRINFLQTEIGKYLLERQNYNYLHKDQKKFLKNQRSFKSDKNKEVLNVSSGDLIIKKSKYKPKKSIFKQKSIRSHKSNLIGEFIENINNTKKKSMVYKKNYKFRNNKLFQIIKDIYIIPRKIKSSKFLNKLHLENEKNKIKKKRNNLDKTTIPFLSLEFYKNHKTLINQHNNNNDVIPKPIILAIPANKIKIVEGQK